jgi:hypothetical protein
MTKDEAERVPFHSVVYTLHRDIAWKRYVLGKKATFEVENFIMLGLGQNKDESTTDLNWVRSDSVHLRPSSCLAEHAKELNEDVVRAKSQLEEATGKHAMAFNQYVAAKKEEDDG